MSRGASGLMSEECVASPLAGFDQTFPWTCPHPPAAAAAAADGRSALISPLTERC